MDESSSFQKLLPLSLDGMVGSSEELLDRYTRCMVCGGHLHFRHQTDFSRNLAHESAQCPECGIKAKSLTFLLQ